MEMYQKIGRQITNLKSVVRIVKNTEILMEFVNYVLNIILSLLQAVAVNKRHAQIQKKFYLMVLVKHVQITSLLLRTKNHANNQLALMMKKWILMELVWNVKIMLSKIQKTTNNVNVVITTSMVKMVWVVFVHYANIIRNSLPLLNVRHVPLDMWEIRTFGGKMKMETTLFVQNACIQIYSKQTVKHLNVHLQLQPLLLILIYVMHLILILQQNVALIIKSHLLLAVLQPHLNISPH